MTYSSLKEVTKAIEESYGGLASSQKIILHKQDPQNCNKWRYMCAGCQSFRITVVRRRIARSPDIYYMIKDCVEHIGCKCDAGTTTERDALRAKSVGTQCNMSDESAHRANWASEENQARLREAVRMVEEDHVSQAYASVKMGVPQSTLSKTITGKRKCDDHVGRPSLIPPTLENSIEMYCLKMSDSGWGLSRGRLQPLDVSVFHSVKQNVLDGLTCLLMDSLRLTKYDVAAIFDYSWKKAINNNVLGRVGMKATGIYPFNENWVDENMDKMKMSDNFSISGKNGAILKLAAEENVELMPEAEDMLTARKLLHVLQDHRPDMENILKDINVETDELESMLLRVINKHYNDLVVDKIAARPWWRELQAKSPHFSSRSGTPENRNEQNNEGSECDSDTDGTENDSSDKHDLAEEIAKKPKLSLRTHTAWGESRSAPLDLNAPERIEAMINHDREVQETAVKRAADQAKRQANRERNAAEAERK